MLIGPLNLTFLWTVPMMKINYLLDLNGVSKYFAARMELSRGPDQRDIEIEGRGIAAVRHG